MKELLEKDIISLNINEVEEFFKKDFARRGRWLSKPLEAEAPQLFFYSYKEIERGLYNFTYGNFVFTECKVQLYNGPEKKYTINSYNVTKNI